MRRETSIPLRFYGAVLLALLYELAHPPLASTDDLSGR